MAFSHYPVHFWQGRYTFRNQNCTGRYNFGCENCTAQYNFRPVQFLRDKPQEVVLGEPFYKNTMSGVKRKKVSTYKKFYFVSLLDTLKRLLSTTTTLQKFFILNNVLRNHQLWLICVMVRLLEHTRYLNQTATLYKMWHIMMS